MSAQTSCSFLFLFHNVTIFTFRNNIRHVLFVDYYVTCRLHNSFVLNFPLDRFHVQWLYFTPNVRCQVYSTIGDVVKRFVQTNNSVFFSSIR